MYEKLSSSPFLTLQLDYSTIYLILLCEHTPLQVIFSTNNNRQEDLQGL